jgi:hypothetical protein
MRSHLLNLKAAAHVTDVKKERDSSESDVTIRYVNMETLMPKAKLHSGLETEEILNGDNCGDSHKIPKSFASSSLSAVSKGESTASTQVLVHSEADGCEASDKSMVYPTSSFGEGAVLVETPQG